MSIKPPTVSACESAGRDDSVRPVETTDWDVESQLNTAMSLDIAKIAQPALLNPEHISNLPGCGTLWDSASARFLARSQEWRAASALER
jgi:hypothetical protein